VKLVTAVLAPDKLGAVAAALAEKEIFRMTVTECRGVLRPLGGTATGDPTAVQPAEKVRLEIAVNESFLAPTLDAIRSAGSLADDGGLGFGKIFVSELLDVVRIRTGERGPDAI
jgi:nitrogen regulatory protein P-II 2